MKGKGFENNNPIQQEFDGDSGENVNYGNINLPGVGTQQSYENFVGNNNEFSREDMKKVKIR